MRNQGNSQLCVGNAVADIVTHHSGRRVSAFSVSVRNFQSRRGLDYLFFNPVAVVASDLGPMSRFMIGLASSTLETSRRVSLCADDQLGGELSYSDRDLKELWDAYQYVRSYFGPTPPVEKIQVIAERLKVIAPSLNPLPFVLSLRRENHMDQALGKWFDRECGERFGDDLEVVGTELGRKDPDRIIAVLDAALDSGAIAAIHYDPGVLRAQEPDRWKTIIGTHVSTIVAKRLQGGERQYLLRNSWGPNCQYYSDGIYERCDRGHIWLTEAEVRSHSTSAAYYRKLRP